MAENSSRINPLTGKPGPAPKQPVPGNKQQARQRINVEVRTGYRPHPNSMPCADCGHIWAPGERRHEYDHHKGYDSDNHMNVEPVCTTCHAARDSHRKHQTHCMRGHEFSTENTWVAANGTRKCKACMKERQKNRPPRGSEYWKKTNFKRRAKLAGRALDGKLHDEYPVVDEE